jgi:hypothetical protein
MINFSSMINNLGQTSLAASAKKPELPKGIEKAKETVPEHVKDKIDIKFPGSGGDDGNNGGISG